MTREKLRHIWREWLSPLAFALVFTQFGATAVGVDGVSMLPTLRHGEHVLIPKMEGWAHQIGIGQYARGDIVVFKPPREAAYEWKQDYRGIHLPWSYRPYLIKRVVGLPGDRVRLQAGRLYINGKIVAEPQIQGYWNRSCHDLTSDLANTVAATPQETGVAEITVPAEHYFVMGDNRSLGGSLDSRLFGPVDVHDIAGRAVASFWPLAAKAVAQPSCDGLPNPQDRVQYSGNVIFNPRWLSSNNH